VRLRPKLYPRELLLALTCASWPFKPLPLKLKPADLLGRGGLSIDGDNIYKQLICDAAVGGWRSANKASTDRRGARGQHL